MRLFTEEEIKQSRPLDLLKGKCDACGDVFLRTKQGFRWADRKKSQRDFCSPNCARLSNKNGSPPAQVECAHCKNLFFKRQSQINTTKNNFCSQSCSGCYSNLHKTHGGRRSKLEVWLEEELAVVYPHLEFLFNKKEIINSELDIYIPALKLAFELNGIFHYEPIYGAEKLSQIKNNDSRKFQACLEQNIQLCIIDTSGQKYFKPSTSEKYLNIIKMIIDQSLMSELG